MRTENLHLVPQGSLKSIGDETFPSFHAPSTPGAPLNEGQVSITIDDPTNNNININISTLGTVAEGAQEGRTSLKVTPQPSATLPEEAGRSLEKHSTGVRSQQGGALDRKSLGARSSAGGKSNGTLGQSEGPVEPMWHPGHHGLARRSRGSNPTIPGGAAAAVADGELAVSKGRLEPPLVTESAGVMGHFIATANEDHVAPSVMVWTADYFDVEVGS